MSVNLPPVGVQGTQAYILPYPDLMPVARRIIDSPHPYQVVVVSAIGRAAITVTASSFFFFNSVELMGNASVSISLPIESHLPFTYLATEVFRCNADQLMVLGALSFFAGLGSFLYLHQTLIWGKVPRLYDLARITCAARSAGKQISLQHPTMHAAVAHKSRGPENPYEPPNTITSTSTPLFRVPQIAALKKPLALFNRMGTRLARIFGR